MYSSASPNLPAVCGIGLLFYWAASKIISPPVNAFAELQVVSSGTCDFIPMIASKDFRTALADSFCEACLPSTSAMWDSTPGQLPPFRFSTEGRPFSRSTTDTRIGGKCRACILRFLGISVVILPYAFVSSLRRSESRVS